MRSAKGLGRLLWRRLTPLEPAIGLPAAACLGMAIIAAALDEKDPKGLTPAHPAGILENYTVGLGQAGGTD